MLECALECALSVPNAFACGVIITVVQDGPLGCSQKLVGVDVGLGAQLLAVFAVLGEPAWPRAFMERRACMAGVLFPARRAVYTSMGNPLANDAHMTRHSSAKVFCSHCTCGAQAIPVHVAHKPSLHAHMHIYCEAPRPVFMAACSSAAHLRQGQYLPGECTCLPT